MQSKGSMIGLARPRKRQASGVQCAIDVNVVYLKDGVDEVIECTPPVISRNNACSNALQLQAVGTAAAPYISRPLSPKEPNTCKFACGISVWVFHTIVADFVQWLLI
jgi:hypothetical protein